MRESFIQPENPEEALNKKTQANVEFAIIVSVLDNLLATFKENYIANEAPPSELDAELAQIQSEYDSRIAGFESTHEHFETLTGFAEVLKDLRNVVIEYPEYIEKALEDTTSALGQLIISFSQAETSL